MLRCSKADFEEVDFFVWKPYHKSRRALLTYTLSNTYIPYLMKLTSPTRRPISVLALSNVSNRFGTLQPFLPSSVRAALGSPLTAMQERARQF